LKEYFFSDMGRTAEDRLRAADYARQRMRPLLRSGATRDDYLDDLGLWVEPGLAVPGDLDRLAQMAGKTNQFNATTIRRTRGEFEEFLGRPDCRVFVFRAGDRFGEQGLVCYVVADVATRRITDFVMSCRAMGRTLEQFAYGYVVAQLGFAPEIDFVPTAKNAPFAAFLRALADGTLEPTRFKARK
jgi:FkbH-like protein